MAIPLLVDFYWKQGAWEAFAFSMGLSAFCGVLFILANKQKEIKISGRQAFVLTALSWVVLCFFSALPFWIGMDGLGFTNAVFESVSGLTTTGSTIMTGLDSLPRGILMWRALLQWLGGVGIIVMAISILPFLRIGGMQLFRLESSQSEKVMPRVAELASYIIYIYIGLSALCALCYYLVGMKPFDAIAHSMTTISTGGFSTHDTSFSGYSGYGPEVIAMVFMVLGCFPFVLFIKCVIGDWGIVFRDQQTRGFLTIVLVSSLIMIFYLIFKLDKVSINIIVEAMFTTTSMLTGTGFTDTNYMTWGGFAVGFLLFNGFIGGCAGSTACGIKIFRFQILYEVAKTQLKQLIYPNGVFTVSYNDQPLSVQIAAAVMAYFFVFIVSFVLFSIALLACELDLTTALSGSITSLSNIGAGLGPVIGPTGSFLPLPDTAKWIMIVGMMLGRLEFFPLLVFLMPQFWRA